MLQFPVPHLSTSVRTSDVPCMAPTCRPPTGTSATSPQPGTVGSWGQPQPQKLDSSMDTYDAVREFRLTKR